MTERPRVSLIVPNYNHAAFLPGTLRALAAQTRPADEILVIDDASRDDSVAIVVSFLAEMPNLRLIRNAENLGVSRTVNRGLAEARSEFVVPTAVDDWLDPRFIERMTAAIGAAPQTRLCTSQYVEYLEADGRTIRHGPESELGPWYVADDRPFYSPDDLLGFLRCGFVWLPINCALVHRETFLAVGGLDPLLKWHSDWFATYAIALRHGFSVVPEPLSAFRVAKGTYSGVGMRDRAKQIAVCMAIVDKLGQAGFEDVGERMRRHPAALAPFMRHLLQGLATRPGRWPFLADMLRWWGGEVLKGRRPGFLRDAVKSLRRSNDPSTNA